MDTWVLFSKKNGTWEFKGFTQHEEFVVEFEEDNTIECDTCDGEGKIKCGAHLPGDGCEDLLLDCPDCEEGGRLETRVSVCLEDLSREHLLPLGALGEGETRSADASLGFFS